MGLFSKIKDLFTDVVEEPEPIKKEVIKVEIASPKEEKIEIEGGANISDSDVVNKGVKTPAPVFFSDSDFEDLRYTSVKRNQSSKKIYGNQLKNEKAKEEPKVFKPSPIISPIYGVLDKNYSKDDISVKQVITTKKEISSKELSIDLVRRKAFGTLEEELETEILNTNSILFKETEQEIEEMDLFDELKNKQEEVSYTKEEEDFFEDLTLREETDEEVTETNQERNQNLVDELEQVFDKDDKLTEDDLFDLIDSMYEDGDDNDG